MNGLWMNAEHPGVVSAVEGRDRGSRDGQQLLGEALEVVLGQQVVVADDPHPVARTGHATGGDRLLDPAHGLVAVGLGVLAQLPVGVVAKHPRGEPQLPDRHPLQQVGEAAAVVQIRVGEREPGQVRPAVRAGRQQLDQPVDDRHVGVVGLVGLRHVMQVDLQDARMVDEHRGAVAVTDGPEHQPSVRHRVAGMAWHTLPSLGQSGLAGVHALDHDHRGGGSSEHDVMAGYQIGK